MLREKFYYRYSTEEYHPDNEFTLTDYLNNRMSDRFSVIFQNGNYAEIRRNETMTVSGVTAQGDGDSYNHLIIFEDYE